MSIPPLLNTPPEVLGEIAGFLKADDVFTLLDSHPLIGVLLLGRGGVTSFFWNKEAEQRVTIRLKTKNLFRRLRRMTVRMSPFLIDWCEVAARSELIYWSKQLTSIDFQSRDAMELWYERGKDGQVRAMNLNELFPRLERLRLQGWTWKRLVVGRNAPSYPDSTKNSTNTPVDTQTVSEWTSELRKDFARNLPLYLVSLSLSHYDDFEAEHLKRLTSLQYLEVSREALSKIPDIRDWPDCLPPSVTSLSCPQFGEAHARNLPIHVTSLSVNFEGKFSAIQGHVPRTIKRLEMLRSFYAYDVGPVRCEDYPPGLESLHLDVGIPIIALPRTLTELRVMRKMIQYLSSADLPLLPPDLTRLHLPYHEVDLALLPLLPPYITDLAIAPANPSSDTIAPPKSHFASTQAPNLAGYLSKDVFPSRITSLSLRLKNEIDREQLLQLLPSSVLHLTLLGPCAENLCDHDVTLLPNTLQSFTAPQHSLTEKCLEIFPRSLCRFQTDHVHLSYLTSAKPHEKLDPKVIASVKRAWRQRFGDLPSDNFEVRHMRH